MVEGMGTYSPLLDWGIAAAPHPGEPRSGDDHVICTGEDGVLIGVVDGLGHGEEAAAAAARAIAIVRAHSDGSLTSLLGRCHRELIGTRGVVMCLARFGRKQRMLSWLCVGNVQGVLVRADPRGVPRLEPLLSRNGVVGLHIPRLQESVVSVARGDLLVIATDGIAPEFVDRLVPGPPEPLARDLLETFRLGSDDALVVIGRFLGVGVP